MRIESASDSATLHRRLNAPPELVFAAFADPLLVRRWLRPRPEFRLDVLTYDFRVGGAYRFAYHAPNGDLMHVSGKFELIEQPTRLTFSWVIEPPDEHAGIQSEVRVTITRAGAGSELRIRHIKLDRSGAPQRHAEGWCGAIDQLAAFIDVREHHHDGG